MDSLENLLDGEPEVTEEVKEVSEEKTEEPTGEEETEESKEDKTEVKPEELSPDSDEPKLDHAALLGERKRRQAAEQKLQDLEKEKPKLTSPFEDEEKFAADIDNRIEARVVAAELAISERYARKVHGDEVVDSAIEWFKDSDSPLLIKKFQESGNDVDMVVDLYNKNLAAKELDDIDAYKAKIEAEVRAKVELEMKGKEEEKTALKDSIPESLVGEDSKGSLKSSDWSGPTDLESLIG